MTPADLSAARGYLAIRRQREQRHGHALRVQAIDTALLAVEMCMQCVADEEGAFRRRARAEAPTTPLQLPGFEMTAVAPTKALEVA